MFDRFVGHTLRGISIACLTGLFLLILINVVSRTFQIAGLAWFDEVIEGLFAWMVFIGTAALWRENDHFRVGWLVESVPPRAARLISVFVVLLEISFLIAMTRYGYDLAMRSQAMTPILNLPTSLFYASIPVGGAVMLFYSVRDLWCALRSPVSNVRIHSA